MSSNMTFLGIFIEIWLGKHIFFFQFSPHRLKEGSFLSPLQVYMHVYIIKYNLIFT